MRGVDASFSSWLGARGADGADAAGGVPVPRVPWPGPCGRAATVPLRATHERSVTIRSNTSQGDRERRRHIWREEKSPRFEMPNDARERARSRGETRGGRGT